MLNKKTVIVDMGGCFSPEFPEGSAVAIGTDEGPVDRRQNHDAIDEPLRIQVRTQHDRVWSSSKSQVRHPFC